MFSDSGCSLNVKWEGSDHLGVIPLEFLKENCYSNKDNKEHEASQHRPHRKVLLV